MADTCRMGTYISLIVSLINKLLPLLVQRMLIYVLIEGSTFLVLLIYTIFSNFQSTMLKVFTVKYINIWPYGICLYFFYYLSEVVELMIIYCTWTNTVWQINSLRANLCVLLWCITLSICTMFKFCRKSHNDAKCVKQYYDHVHLYYNIIRFH